MEFKLVSVDDFSLSKYKVLFDLCFPKSKQHTIQYLSWLYKENPEGYALGYDAFDGRKLAAHYACIPTIISLNGKLTKSLLSLNTATHPKYRKKGLFIKLAELTYELASKSGFECVFGFANNNSTYGFVKKLGFQMVSSLDAYIGFGRFRRFNWDAIQNYSVFHRHWTEESLHWRMANPSNPCYIQCVSNRIFAVFSSAWKTGIIAYTENRFNFTIEATKRINPFLPRVFVGILPQPLKNFNMFIPIPNFLRPSPLNFIFKYFIEERHQIDNESVFVSYIDFDAF